VLLVTILAVIVIGDAGVVMFHATDVMQWHLAVKAFMWAIGKVLVRHHAIESSSTMVFSLRCRDGSRSGILVIHSNEFNQ
jgi:hypothetical protein